MLLRTGAFPVNGLQAVCHQLRGCGFERNSQAAPASLVRGKGNKTASCAMSMAWCAEHEAALLREGGPSGLKCGKKEYQRDTGKLCGTVVPSEVPAWCFVI